MSLGTPVTKTSIVNEFNSRVVQYLRDNASLGTAVWHSGNQPFTPSQPSHFGSQTEPGDRTETDITVNGLTPTNIFNIIHGWAMEMTRMRTVRAYTYMTNMSGRQIGTPSTSSQSRATAMSDHYMKYFQLPISQPDGGTMMNWEDLQDFMDLLKLEVKAIRDSSVDLYGCHSSCHSSCHGSRGRR